MLFSSSDVDNGLLRELMKKFSQLAGRDRRQGENGHNNVIMKCNIPFIVVAGCNSPFIEHLIIL